MAKDWEFPQDSKTDRSGFMEHRSGRSGGRAPDRGEFNDQQLADALDVSVPTAHDMIEDVTEHRSTDLLDED